MGCRYVSGGGDDDSDNKKEENERRCCCLTTTTLSLQKMSVFYDVSVCVFKCPAGTEPRCCC